MKIIVIVAILLLAVLHQDTWWWDDPTPVFGFMPIGLAWHMGISLVSGIVGWVAVTTCWPVFLEDGALEDGPLEDGDRADDANGEGQAS